MTFMLLGQITVGIKKESDSILSILTDPGFIGSLVGSVLAGGVALGILLYETRERAKDKNFKCYGTMKALIARLTTLSEMEKNINMVQSTDKAFPKERENLTEILNKTKIVVESAFDFLERERENIPPEFISRYHTLTNSIELVLRQYDRVEKTKEEGSILGLSQRIQEANRIIENFIVNSNLYIKEIEKKYKIKDFY